MTRNTSAFFFRYAYRFTACGIRLTIRNYQDFIDNFNEAKRLWREERATPVGRERRG